MKNAVSLKNSLASQALGFRFDRERIARLLSRQPELERNFDLNLFHAEKLRAEYVYNTAALEGNSFTFPEVETLLSGVTVGGRKVSEHQQILNQNASWSELIRMLRSGEFSVAEQTILSLHEKIAFEEAREWGTLRTGQVKIGGTDYLPPKAELLPRIFEQGTDALAGEENVFLRAFSAFLFLSLNQFFWDGNKRAGRLMMNGILLNEGLPMFVLEARDRLEIGEQVVNFYETREATKILEFLLRKYFGSVVVSFFIKE